MSFINLIKSVKLCLKVILRLLASRLVGACLTFLNIFLIFTADELNFIRIHEHESSSGLHIRLSHYQHFLFGC